MSIAWPRTNRCWLGAGLALALWLAPMPVAGAVRVAIVAGNNRGDERQAALRYANRDAHRFADLLETLGGFAPEQILFLDDAPAAAFRNALAQIESDLNRLPPDEKARSLLLFYFSGHSNGISLQLGGTHLPFEELRERLGRASAGIKIAFIDSCHSGGLTNTKGGRPGPAFELSIASDLNASGTAIVTSSASGEKSQESEEIQGSFFTHHLISGLRGAADRNQDARVTLSEVYGYAYGKTVVETARTVTGSQHPSYDYDIAGRGEVVLTDLSRASSFLVFGPALAGSFLVIDQARGELATELSKPSAVTRWLALPAGEYLVAHRKNGELMAQAVSLPRQGQIRVQTELMQPEPTLLASLKGGSRTRTGLALFGQYSLSSGALNSFGVLHQGALGARVDIGPISLLPRLAYGEANVREPEAKILYRLQLFSFSSALTWRWEYSFLDLLAGLSLGLSYGIQSLTDAREFRGTVLTGGLIAGVDMPIHGDLTAHFFWQAGTNLYRLGDELDSHLTMQGMVGIGYAL